MCVCEQALQDEDKVEVVLRVAEGQHGHAPHAPGRLLRCQGGAEGLCSAQTHTRTICSKYYPGTKTHTLSHTHTHTQKYTNKHTDTHTHTGEQRPVFDDLALDFFAAAGRRCHGDAHLLVLQLSQQRFGQVPPHTTDLHAHTHTQTHTHTHTNTHTHCSTIWLIHQALCVSHPQATRG